MSASIDLTECENEPITIPGAIQPHGVLLVLSPGSLIVVQVSSNSLEFLGVVPAEILGRSIKDWIDENSFSALNQAAGWGDPREANPLTIILRVKPDEIFDGIIHRSGGLLTLEMERRRSRLNTASIHGVLPLIHNARTEIDACRIAAEKTRLLTGFDRVMVYRFAPDWSGEVVAEAKAEGITSYLGLHFPASDIPKQARELYTRKLQGTISCVAYTPVKVLTLQLGTPPLDMSQCALRSVSPIHLEFLRNMGVMASLTISLVISGELWGIIACHHEKPWFGPFALRQDCQLLGQVTASVIEARAADAGHSYRVKRTELLAQFLKKIAMGDDFVKSLTEGQPNLLDFVDSSGAAVLFEEGCTTVGEVPDRCSLRMLQDWLVSKSNQLLFVTHTLPLLYPPAAQWQTRLCGSLAVQILVEYRCYVVWFRSESIRTVTWAGDPAKPVSAEEGSQIGPRKSFDKWKEIVEGQSRPWTEAEIESAAELRNTLSGALTGQIERARISRIELQANQAQAEKEAEIRLLNEALEQRVVERTAELEAANKELEAFSYSVSHDLRAPLRAINGFSEIVLQEFGSQLSEEGQGYLERICQGGKRMGELIDDLLRFSGLSRHPLNRKTVDMGKVAQEAFTDVKSQENNREIEFRLGGLPSCEADPGLLRQVWINLLSNAIKYTRGRKPAIVEINWSSTESGNVYFVRDNGTGFDMKHIKKLFGVFQRLHHSDQFEGTGVGLAIVERIIHRHGGRVWAEAAVDRGATFSFTTQPGKKP